MPARSQAISTSLTALTDNELLNYTTTLAANLGSVEEYKEIKPTLAEGEALGQAFGKAIANAARGGQFDRMERDKLRQQVEDLVNAWSAFATRTTPADPLRWAKAHFRLTKADTTPRAPLAAPTRFAVSDGPAKGSVQLSQNAQAGTKAYVFEYAPVPADGATPPWQYCLGNKGTCILTGLTSGQQYMFRVAAWNGTGETAYSAVETRYVQ